ncbi:MAG: UDP-3-O-acylglucosamine N-acyltransferase [Alphaproteobacteria bacterium MarineAlpha5_Bin9]|nr:MAG: UDP-3-O-acylglucosamine N-acyltransferase [Alphaproteobacteria bacterium MarineAlpha5_Bin9]|tara:strand:- start:14754 stop:15743 length:990 start_codon:yes stop_codon:yes gene_type:complete
MNNKFSLKDIKNYLSENYINIQTNLNDNTIFDKISTLDSSTSNDLTFFHNEKYLNYLSSTKAKACLIKDIFADKLNGSCTPIIVKDPYLSFAYISQYLFNKTSSNGIIDPKSNISNKVEIGKNVQINKFVSILENTFIDDNVIIAENAVIGPNVYIKKNSYIMPNCVISNSEIGADTIIQSGSIIGGEGFGFTPEKKIEIKHLGKVIIGNNVDIGSNTTIDRGSLNNTVIGNNSRIDNLVQVAHNVIIGDNCIIASQTGIAGSTIIGNNCQIGGQAGISGHLKIGDNVIIAAKSGVTKNIKSGFIVAGFPAQDIKIWKKSIIKQYKDIK